MGRYERLRRWLPPLSGFAWGLAEATWFFIVPDVLLSYWAWRSVWASLTAVIGVLIGALVGAAILYRAGHAHGVTESIAAWHRLWSEFPGFKPRMAEVAAGHLRAGAIGLIYGPSSGIPYRVYVAEALRAGIPLRGVLLWTPIARLERIILAPLVVGILKFLLERVLPRWWSAATPRRMQRLLAFLIVAYWIGLYAWYWGTLVPRMYG